MADQRDVVPPVGQVDLPGGVQQLHDHHAEVEIDAADDLVALGLVKRLP